MSFACLDKVERPDWEHTFGVDPLVGWRVWEIETYRHLDGSDDLRLSPISGELLWHPHERAHAVCTASRRGRHEAPQPDCRCGLWAVRDREAAERTYAGQGNPSVLGPVALWGRVLEFEHGYRAQYAYPLALYGEPGMAHSVRGLGRVYGVPAHVEEITVKPLAPPATATPRNSIRVYQNLARHLWSDIDWCADTIRLSLHTSQYQPQLGSDEFFSHVGHEIPAGGGYPAGGIELANKSYEKNEQTLVEHYRAAPVHIAQFTAGRSVRYAVVRKDAGDPARSPLLALLDTGSDLQPSKEPFLITWSRAGVITVSVV